VELRKIDYFGRYGGEEFMLILSDTGLDGALVTTERLRENLQRARHVDVDPNLVQTVSIGVVEFRRGESIEQALLRADRAMYKAKAKGRNRVESEANV
jgi:diguanylate cyclase